MATDLLYDGRAQTLVKHYVLQHYLELLTLIVGSRRPTVTYVDGFAGPWEARAPDLEDTSFAIAVRELRRARETLRQRGKTLNVRCLFVEKDKEAFDRLRRFSESCSDIEVLSLNEEFEAAVPKVVRFVRDAGRDSFSFVFVDPKGWTGFRMAALSPLLRLRPGEVMINFMTGHVRRFVESPAEQTRESFVDLFGSGDLPERLAGLSGQDREDAVVRAYCENVKREGEFSFVCTAMVLHPLIKRTHFHLVYATRHWKGVKVFKEVEERAMEKMEEARAAAGRRQRESRLGQHEMLDPIDLHDSSYYDELRDRYTRLARDEVATAANQRKRLPYDTAWDLALSHPLVWERDLKEWIRSWREEGALRIDGMTQRQRVPKRGDVLVALGEIA